MTGKYIIAGSRDFADFELMERVLKEFEIGEIVCGGARGADLLGKEYADKHNIPVKMFPADWKKFKNAAGPLRNIEMAEYADGLIAFWDGKSTGTAHMIKEANRRKLYTAVIKYILPPEEKW
jgi:hypothetical protein